ncbi:hypothetical protein [Celeribacter arenosi]|uniref:Bacteriophage head to tail connecting protein n=1 Tax=Celeribacter arenosi TaxID=792649 RepID=A0ABP7KIL8_9RHOB
MTTPTFLDEDAHRAELKLLARFLLHRLATKSERDALWRAGGLAEGQVAQTDLESELASITASTEEGDREQACESVAALVARGMLRTRVQKQTGTSLQEEQRKWISNNISAHSSTVHRARAIWMSEAGLADEHQRKIYDHALASAIAGTTGENQPGREPETTPNHSEKEDPVMLDPTNLREAILTRFKFNLAGLPASLRNIENQKIFLDAVIQSVALLGHEPVPDGEPDDNLEAMVWSSATAGLLLLDGHYDPRDGRFFQKVQKAVAELSGSAVETNSVEIDGHGVNMFAPDKANTQKIAVFFKTETALREKGGRRDKLFLQSLASTSRKMIDRYDDHGGDVEHMGSLAAAAYDTHVSVASGGGSNEGVANVELPPLHDPNGYNDEIEPDNIRAVSTIYVSHQLEFMIKACMRIVDLFTAGLLPIAASESNVRAIDDLAWNRDDFLDESARRSVQARVLGAPGGQIAFDQQPNAEFNMLLMRVVSAVAEFEREQNIITHFDNAARGVRFQVTSGEFVRKAIRDFAANASLRGWAGTAFTAERLSDHIKAVMKVLNLPAVKTAFGVTTPWQVVERVSQREFGITVNTVLHRTLAVETQNIMRIIADNHTVWSGSPLGKPLFSIGQDGEGDLSMQATHELMVASQHFRAVTGLGDAQLSEFSEPEAATAVPSLPDIGGMGGGMGGSVPGVNMDAVAQLQQMANSGTTDPDQVMALLRTMN